MDGIDAALLTTDGERITGFGPARTLDYDADFASSLGHAVTTHQADEGLVRELTERHAEAVLALVKSSGVAPDVIGFHGQTILHDPDNRRTVQIGDGALLARLTGIPVVCDFRSADVAAGGQGAPFVPIYHRALAFDEPKPIALLNIGGVANVTWVGVASDGASGDGLLAFDTGPGIALIDDWVRKTVGGRWDEGGKLAASGKVDAARLANLLDHPFFDQAPPKSLDRNSFKTEFLLNGCSPADGAATLVRFTAECVARARRHFEGVPSRWIACGGGRRNDYLLETLRAVLDEPVVCAEDMGWDGDALEAQAFAYLAVRHMAGLPLSFPSTTGVPRPMAGGTVFRP
ncbi:MAG: anmK [Rhodospirillales bacterium]|nr:anmK [Rhodospirillales bacterium]